MILASISKIEIDSNNGSASKFAIYLFHGLTTYKLLAWLGSANYFKILYRMVLPRLMYKD